MRYKSAFNFICIFLLLYPGIFISVWGQGKLSINDQGYFEMRGLNIMVFGDYYLSGHQSGITIIQNGVHVAANCDISLDRWSEKGPKKVDRVNGAIQAQMNYPNIPFQYNGPMDGMNVKPYAEGKSLTVAPEMETQRLTVRSLKGKLQLVDDGPDFMFLVLATDHLLKI
jgi:hypothetical protein